MPFISTFERELRGLPADVTVDAWLAARPRPAAPAPRKASKHDPRGTANGAGTGKA